MPKNDHYVVIGNGPAGNKAVDRLRAEDQEARVTIISDEAFSFYYRYKLPDFIADRISEDSLKARPYTIYKEKNIRLRLGQRVERIDPDEKGLSGIDPGARGWKDDIRDRRKPLPQNAWQAQEGAPRHNPRCRS